MTGHARERAAWFVAALAAVALAVAPPGTLPAPLAAVALALTFGIVPGALLVRALAPGEASDTRTAMALVLSPFLAGIGLLFVRLGGAGAAPAAQAVALAMALPAAAEALRPRARDATAPSDRGVWALALLVGAALALAHLMSPALTARSDGSFHAGVVWAAARALPPQDPYFAGLALRYFWGLHAWAAGWVALAPGLGAYAPLVATSALAAVAALLAVGALTRALGGSPRVRLLAQALALAGSAPFAWLVLVARAASGDVRGDAEWTRALGHGADAALRALDPGLLHPSLVLALDKFVVLTPFAWALAGAAVLALALLRGLADDGEPNGRAGLGLALVVAAVVFVHPAAGLALAAAALAGAAWAARGMPRSRRALGGIALSLAAGVAAMTPYLRSLATGGEAAGVAWGWTTDARGLVSSLYAGAFLLVPLCWRRAREAAAEPGRSLIVGMLVALIVPACALHVAGENESKFLNLAFVLASAPAALAWARAGRARARRPALAAVLALGIAPTLAVMVWAYAHESAASADAPSCPPRAIVAAVRDRVPADAVLVDATQDTTRGAAPGLPAETGRALLWSGGFLARKWGYAEAPLRLRRAAAEALARGQWPAADDGGWLPAPPTELWMILPDSATRATTFEEEVVARADGVRLVKLDAPR